MLLAVACLGFHLFQLCFALSSWLLQVCEKVLFMMAANPLNDASDPLAALQRWITYTQAELQSLRLDFRSSVQVCYGSSAAITNQLQALQHQVNGLEDNLREVNDNITQLHQDLSRVRALVSQLLRDISSTQHVPVPPESLATLLLE